MVAYATGREPSLSERVAARVDTLSPTERKIADYLANHPEEAAIHSAQQMGTRLDASDASVVRTVKKLGYTGLPELRNSLRAKVEELLTPAGRLSNSLTALGDSGGILVHAVIRDQIALLQQALQTVDPDQFDRAVALIAHAHTTVACGIGTLGDLAEYLRLKLTRLGRSARTARTTGFLLADDLIGLQQDDVVLLMVHSRVSAETMAVLERAREVGATVILVTDMLGQALAEWVSVVITAPMGRPGMFSGYTTTLVLLEAFVFAVANVDAKRSLETMATMNRLRQRLSGGTVGGMAVLREALAPRNGSSPAAPGNGATARRPAAVADGAPPATRPRRRSKGTTG
jgi:DNA-binding MurR/RpiR family transcriptional regulator